MRWQMYANNQSFFDSQDISQTYAILEPHLKLELNKSGTLEFDILPTHPMYNSFTRMTTYIRVTLDNDEVFRGRVLSIEDGMYLERHINCEGDLSFLIDSLQFPDQVAEKNLQTTSNTETQTGQTQETTPTNETPATNEGEGEGGEDPTPEPEPDPMTVNLAREKATHESLYDHFVRYITVHNEQMETQKRFSVGNVTIDDRLVEQDFTSTSYRDTMSALQSDLLKVYGGYLFTRKTNGTVYIDWLKEPGTDALQQFKMGVNLIDLQKKSDSTDIFTVLVPIGDNQLTIASVNNNSIAIENATGIAAYGRIYKTVSFGGVSDPTELMRLGQSYMDTNYKGDPVTISVKAIDMNLIEGNTEKIKVGSGVTVVSAPHNLSIKLVCTSIDYDIFNPENNAYEIGDPKETLSQKQTTEKISMNQSVSNAGQTSTVVYQNTLELEEMVNKHAEKLQKAIDELNNLIGTDPDTGTTIIKGSGLYIQGPATISGKLDAGTLEVEGDAVGGRLVSESTVVSELGYFENGNDISEWANIKNKPTMARATVTGADGVSTIVLNFYGYIS